jgi:PAS domain S-box-containing protein
LTKGGEKGDKSQVMEQKLWKFRGHILKGVATAALVAGIGWVGLENVANEGKKAVRETSGDHLIVTARMAPKERGKTKDIIGKHPEIPRVCHIVEKPWGWEILEEAGEGPKVDRDTSWGRVPAQTRVIEGHTVAIIKQKSKGFELWWRGKNEKERIARIEEQKTAGGFYIWLAAVIAGTATGWGSIKLSRREEQIQRDAQQLEETEKEIAFLNAVAEKTKNGVIMCNREGKITWCNRGFTDMSGYSQEECWGKKPGEILQGKESDPKTIETIRTALEKKEEWTGEILNHRKDGSAYWCQLEIQPLEDKKGKHRGYLGMQTDIEHQKRQAELEGWLRREAETANLAKTRFVATMSHEIRTPLTGVLGYCELLRQSKLKSPENQYVEKIHESGEMLLGVINEILDFAKIEAGSQKIRNENFGIKSAVQGTALLHESLAQAKGIKLVVENKPEMEVWGDGQIVRQITGNLVSNAVKYSKEGKVGIRWRVENEELEIIVEDEGEGIQPGMEEKIFEPFHQEDGEKRKHGGAGLGLSICRNLAELCGGGIKGENRPGGGAKFTAWVKIKRDGEKEKKPEEKQEESPKKILIVEDNPTNGRLIELMLRQGGHTTTWVDNGEQAVESAKKEDFDLILMDIELPGMSGIESTKAIRAEGINIPVIALTADAQKETEENCRKAAMNGFLTKPIRKRELKERVEKGGGWR